MRRTLTRPSPRRPVAALTVSSVFWSKTPATEATGSHAASSHPVHGPAGPPARQTPAGGLRLVIGLLLGLGTAWLAIEGRRDDLRRTTHDLQNLSLVLAEETDRAFQSMELMPLAVIEHLRRARHRYAGEVRSASWRRRLCIGTCSAASPCCRISRPSRWSARAAPGQPLQHLAAAAHRRG